MAGARAVDRLRAFARGALLLLAALLPFERIEPLARVGPLQLSSVELFLYLALGAWAAALVAGWWTGERDRLPRLRQVPLAHRAVLAFAAALFVSAALAPAARGPALKFALRSAGGLLLYAAAADLLRAPEAVARMASSLVGGAFVAALLTIAEARSGGLGDLLRPFHLQTFEALGQTRASGPFQYPNIAAMYLEALAPLAVALGTLAFAARRSAGAWLGALAIVVGVLLDGVLATGSRAGLVGALALVAALAFVLARGAEGRLPALASIAAVLVVATLASGSALAGRFRFWKDGDWYRATIAQVGGAGERLPPVLAPSSEATESLELRNEGALPWRRSAPTPVVLSYHWLDQEGRVVVFDGDRTFLPDDVYTGGHVRVRALVRAPWRPGRYTLWWDLVHEHTSWFSERGSPGLREEVVVSSGAPGQLAAARTRAPAPGPGVGLVLRAPPGGDRLPRGELWRGAVAAWRAHPWFGIGPDNFRHLSRQFLHRADTDERMHANSLYFETLADLGIVGLLAFLAVIAALAAAARRAAAAPATRLLALGVTAALAAYLVHGVVDHFLEFTPTYALFWLLAGMLVATERQPESPA